MWVGVKCNWEFSRCAYVVMLIFRANVQGDWVGVPQGQGLGKGGVPGRCAQQQVDERCGGRVLGHWPAVIPGITPPAGRS